MECVGRIKGGQLLSADWRDTCASRLMGRGSVFCSVKWFQGCLPAARHAPNFEDSLNFVATREGCATHSTVMDALGVNGMYF